MAKYSIRPFKHGFFSSDLVKVVNLYNVSMIGMYGFHPISVEYFEKRIVNCKKFDPELLLVAHVGDEIVGICHSAKVPEAARGDAGVIELIGVHPKHRNHGIGKALVGQSLKQLQKKNVSFVDGGGTYPFSPFYSTLLDGSERSGPELSNKAFIRILEKYRFHHGRRSLIMRADLQQKLPDLSDDMQEVLQKSHYSVESREGKKTWLDFVFRGWELFDSYLFDTVTNEVLSRAIFGAMPGLSKVRKHNIFAVFGVNTPTEKRGSGYATIHFRELRKYIKSIGGEFIELHCYDDNAPAIALYRKSGFVDVGMTVSMQLSF